MCFEVVQEVFAAYLIYSPDNPARRLKKLACASRASQMPHRKRKKKLKDGLVLKSSSSFTRIFIWMICAFCKVHAASWIQIPTKKNLYFSLLSRDFVPWMQISHHQCAYETKMILQISKPQSWGEKCVSSVSWWFPHLRRVHIFWQRTAFPLAARVSVLNLMSRIYRYTPSMFFVGVWLNFVNFHNIEKQDNSIR